MADFSFENTLWESGIECVGGVDEVGRGCFAGPVYAACVGFYSGVVIPREITVNDSKKLTHNQRLMSKRWIENNSYFYGIGVGSVVCINEKGIVEATRVAMRFAVENARRMIGAKNAEKDMGHLLIDAFYIDGLNDLKRHKQTPIIRGDEMSASIAAASILAKVARDEYMSQIGNNPEYAVYDWVKNKGYGTKAHRQALISYGTTPHHRKQFVETFLKKYKK